MKPEELLQRAEAEQTKQQGLGCRLVCCAGTGCLSSGSKPVIEGLKKALTQSGLESKAQVVGTGCMGLCSRARWCGRRGRASRINSLPISKSENVAPFFDDYVKPMLNAERRAAPS